MLHKLFPMNEGIVDRTFRIVLGLALLALTLRGSSFVWGYIGVLPLLTGIVGSCPAYTVFGITTCPHRPAQKTT
jgi:DUF2892 family protein